MYCQRQFCFIEVKHFANTYNTLHKKRNYLSTLPIHTIPCIRNATIRLFYSCGRRKGDNLRLGSTTTLITGPSVASQFFVVGYQTGHPLKCSCSVLFEGYCIFANWIMSCVCKFTNGENVDLVKPNQIQINTNA